MNNQDPLQTDEELLRKTLNIKSEWSVLMEAQNVIDQLQIMQEIFTQQITVMGDFEKALRGLSSDPSEGLKTAIDRAGQLILDMKLRRDELANLEKRQANTRSQVSCANKRKKKKRGKEGRKKKKWRRVGEKAVPCWKLGDGSGQDLTFGDCNLLTASKL